MKRLLFLDIDGVFWTGQSETRKNRMYGKDYKEENLEEFCPIACSNLQWLLEQDDIEIVVSSIWRGRYTKGGLEKLFHKNGVPSAKVIGRTPSGKEGHMRGHEILWWFQESKNKAYRGCKYAIIDDGGDMLPEQNPNFVQTDSMLGLTIYDAALAAEILQTQARDPNGKFSYEGELRQFMSMVRRFGRDYPHS